jgi:hypothetical protein
VLSLPHPLGAADTSAMPAYLSAVRVLCAGEVALKVDSVSYRDLASGIMGRFARFSAHETI